MTAAVLHRYIVNFTFNDECGEVKEADGDRRLRNVEEVFEKCELVNEELELEEVISWVSFVRHVVPI